MHDFEEIEDAFIDALTPLRSQGLKTLDTYSGQIEVDELEELTLQFPCIYVIAGPLWIDEINRYNKYEAEAVLFVGDKNVRGSRAAARGDASSLGVYDLLELARGRLHSKKILSAWAPPLVKREQVLAYMPKESVCIYTATYWMQAVKA